MIDLTLLPWWVQLLLLLLGWSLFILFIWVVFHYLGKEGETKCQ